MIKGSPLKKSTGEGPKGPFYSYNPGKRAKKKLELNSYTCKKKTYVLILSTMVATSDWKVTHMYAGSVIVTWHSSRQVSVLPPTNSPLATDELQELTTIGRRKHHGQGLIWFLSTMVEVEDNVELIVDEG